MWFLKRKYTLVESGVFIGMTDVHTHLLWGVDDGSKSREYSEGMIGNMKSLGMKRAFCTPHIMAGLPENNAVSLRDRFEKNMLPFSADMGFELKLAAEYMMDEAFMPKIEREEELLTYDGKHILVEMSHITPSPDFLEIIFEVQNNGYQPILAHPERYVSYMKKEEYPKLKEIGCELQLNILSLAGSYGTEAKKCAENLLKEGLYDYIGSDIHNPSYRKYASSAKIDSKQAQEIGRLVLNNDLLWG